MLTAVRISVQQYFLIYTANEALLKNILVCDAEIKKSVLCFLLKLGRVVRNWERVACPAERGKVSPTNFLSLHSSAHQSAGEWIGA